MDLFPQVCKGIRKDKHREVTLEIDLKEKRYKVLLKYYQQDDIEDNNGPIDWLSDPVFTSIANLGNIRVKIDMQDANKAIRIRHVI